MSWFRRRIHSTDTEADRALRRAQEARRHAQEKARQVGPVLASLERHFEDNHIAEAVWLTIAGGH